MIWNMRILIAEEVVEAGQEAVWTQLTERVVHMVILGKKSKLVHIFMLKGQLISERLFDVLSFPKNQRNFLNNFCPRI